MRTRRLVVVVTAVLAVAGLVPVGADATAAPRWKRVPASVEYNLPFLAAGRLWFMRPPSSDPHGSWTVAASARVANRRLGPWSTIPQTALAEVNWWLVHTDGDGLVFQWDKDIDYAKWRLVHVPLLPDGTVGSAAEIVGGAPPPASSEGGDFVQLPDRIVRLAAIDNPRNELSPFPGVCCDANGQAVNYAGLAGGNGALRLGLDSTGRLWLAWQRNTRPRFDTRIVQLDPATLRPLGMPAAIPGLPGGKIEAMTCTDTCRLLRWGLDGRKLSVVLWGPGDPSPRRIRPPFPPTCDVCEAVLGARHVDGHLVVAWRGTAGTAGSYRVALARGDALGRNMRVVDSLRVPSTIGRTGFVTGDPTGTLTSEGLAVVANYTDVPLNGNMTMFLRVAALPLH
jgi:hypothetical protein